MFLIGKRALKSKDRMTSIVNPYSTFRTDKTQMMYPQAVSNGNILNFTPPGFKHSLNVKFPDNRLAVCTKCKRNYKTRDMCRVRNRHTSVPWANTFICITLDDSCTDIDGNYVDAPLTVRMVQWSPYCVKKPFVFNTPVCALCKKTNRTKSFCRKRHNHCQLPWCTVYVLLSAVKHTDPRTIVVPSSQTVSSNKIDEIMGKNKKDGKPKIKDEPEIGGNNISKDEIAVPTVAQTGNEQQKFTDALVISVAQQEAVKQSESKNLVEKEDNICNEKKSEEKSAEKKELKITEIKEDDNPNIEKKCCDDLESADNDINASKGQKTEQIKEEEGEKERDNRNIEKKSCNDLESVDNDINASKGHKAEQIKEKEGEKEIEKEGEKERKNSLVKSDKEPLVEIELAHVIKKEDACKEEKVIITIDCEDDEPIKENEEKGDDINDIAESRTFLVKVSCKAITIHWLELHVDRSKILNTENRVFQKPVMNVPMVMNPAQYSRYCAQMNASAFAATYPHIYQQQFMIPTQHQQFAAQAAWQSHCNQQMMAQMNGQFIQPNMSSVPLMVANRNLNLASTNKASAVKVETSDIDKVKVASSLEDKTANVSSIATPNQALSMALNQPVTAIPSTAVLTQSEATWQAHLFMHQQQMLGFQQQQMMAHQQMMSLKNASVIIPNTDLLQTQASSTTLGLVSPISSVSTPIVAKTVESNVTMELKLNERETKRQRTEDI